MKYRRTSRILISQRRYGIINSRKVLIYNRNLPNRSSSFWPATLNFSLVSHKCVTCLKITRSTASCVACKEKLHTKCLTDRLDNGMELFCTIWFVNDDQNTSNFDETDDLPVYEDLNSFSRARELKIYHQNLNGSISKTNHICLLFQQTHKNIHILGISESHLNKHIINKGVMVEGYTTIRKDRSTGTGGAVCTVCTSKMISTGKSNQIYKLVESKNYGLRCLFRNPSQSYYARYIVYLTHQSI